jgi:transposase
MFSVPVHTKIFLARIPVDMRKGFPGLSALTESVLRQDPLSGHLFVFYNRRRDRIKVLYWGGTGFWIGYHQLQKGRFQIPEPDSEETGLEISPTQLSMILGGVDLHSARQRPRFNLAEHRRAAAQTVSP